MKDKNRKYIIVDADNIKKTKRKLERTFAFNDSWRDYVADGEIPCRLIFKEHNIPKEFRKVVIQLPSLPGRRNAKELLTERPFDINPFIRKKEIFADDRRRLYDGDMIESSVHLRSPLQIVNYETVLNFYEKICDNGYLENYLDAIKNIFYLDEELKSSKEPKLVETRAKTLIKTSQQNAS